MCHVVPAASAIITTVLYHRKKDPQVGQLNLMLYGAAIFGFVDHLWNGELFLISDDIGKDLLLGVVITGCVFLGWSLGIFSRRFSRSKAATSPVKIG